ncbi:MAG: phenylalanyl-tRNA synthetase beta chain [Flavobacteriales bacterium]|jgi:phenylalanyl-tRNA synthetase beta chain
MKIAYSWLKQYITVNLPAEEVGVMLTDTGLEVEGIEEVESVKGGLKGVVIGEVLTCEKHPDADRLNVTTVNLGLEEPVQIVCGAPNVTVGIKVAVATVGCTLYDGDESFNIKKSKIRGQASLGMICSEVELGLGEAHEGIMVLDASAVPGTPAAEYFNLENDTVFEIGLTPNRADGFSHIGTARDLRAAMLRHGKPVELQMPDLSAFKVDENTSPITVEVKDETACPRYAGVSIEGITVAPSPEWLQNRLTSIGLSPINNVVDITNFVLHETGQPLHAFDMAKIAGNKVIVQTLEQDTKFVTLDEQERKLNANDLMICNAEGPMCIAGVFGGLESGVSNTTKRIFLESAYFDAVSVRKSAKRHGLNTDASFRFERGVDPVNTVEALKRAALMIQEIAGGKITSEIFDHYPKPVAPVKVDVAYAQITRLVGNDLDKDLIQSILESLDISVEHKTEAGFVAIVPPYRVDVTREVDIIEEILRIYGYNNVVLSGRICAALEHSKGINPEKIYNRVAEQLTGNGFFEIMSNSLTKSSYADKAGFKEEQDVRLLNPLSKDLEVMRQTMLFGGLEAIARNVNRKRADLKFYELGKSYHNYPGGRAEKRTLALWMTGNVSTESWHGASDKAGFFHIKGAVTQILKRFGLELGKEADSKSQLFTEGLSISVGKKKVAELGKVKPNLAKHADVKQEVYYAELDWDGILDLLKTQKVQYTPLAKFPSVRRDLALLIDKNVRFTDLQNTAYLAERKLLKSVNLFDVYEGDKLPEGKKSYALSFMLQDEEQTLSDKQIEKAMQRIQQQLEKQFSAELRG